MSFLLAKSTHRIEKESEENLIYIVEHDHVGQVLISIYDAEAKLVPTVGLWSEKKKVSFVLGHRVLFPITVVIIG